MKQTFLIYLTVLLISMSLGHFSAQTNADLPGSVVINSIYPELSLQSEQGMRLCCFAAYGWHSTQELKFEAATQPLPGEGDDIAKRLVVAGIVSDLSEQFFTMDDGSFVVVSKLETFEKQMSRYVVNANSHRK
mgnify:CR=1 FL=1|tara:strand:+ start:10756 stop:11154 length:399 start_codon:yes stop_codon:yes gene_type:complete